MPRPFRARCRVAIALGLLGMSAARAQSPATLRPPTAVVAETSSTVPILTKSRADGMADGRGFFAGSAGPYAVTSQDEPHLSPSAGWEQVSAASPGWFGALTVGVVRPHVGGHLADKTDLPFASLDWTVMPRLEAGYRLADGAGDLRLGYHLIASTGSVQAGVGGLRSRLDLNALDLDYVSSEWLVEATPDLGRELRAVAGVRLASATLKSSGPAGLFRSEFTGAGPRFGLEWRKPIPAPWPVELYVRSDGTGLAGQTRQTGGFLPLISWKWNGAVAVSTEVGIGWQPTGPDGVRVLFGYQFEQWWNLGRTDAANADLSVNGVFLRAEWRY